MSREDEMNMNNIDEMLNGFLDGELSPRQQTEVERLVANDAKIAARLGELRTCKTFVGSLPAAKAPAGMAEQIMARIRVGTSVSEGRDVIERKRGGRHLMVRRLLAAAAMIALAAVLAGVIYTILSPQSGERRDAASKAWQQNAVKPAESRRQDTVADVVEPFEGQLVLLTRDMVAVDAFVNKAIETNGLQYSVTKDLIAGSTYSVRCGVTGLNTLLSDLETVWSRLDLATLLVSGGGAGYVTIEDVSTGQITRIVNEKSFQERIRLAKDFSVLNNIDRMLPGKEILAFTSDRKLDLITIPKPVLTSGEKATKTGTVQQPGDVGVRLTIVVTAAD
jgi:FlaG/FlaF family flagellin (archaellin)